MERPRPRRAGRPLVGRRDPRRRVGRAPPLGSVRSESDRGGRLRHGPGPTGWIGPEKPPKAGRHPSPHRRRPPPRLALGGPRRRRR
ncbi:MAG TPA: hypothetical protein ENK43_07810 [Planctomycetes bacterium]|nr:hypothetical protein [Planctomycetota bacterium]